MPSDELIRWKNSWSRYGIAAIAVLLLFLIYLFQKFNFSALLGSLAAEHPNLKFIFNRLIRFLLNDISCLLLIVAIFNKKKHLSVGLALFTVELFVLLPLYFVVKLSLEGDGEISSPLLSQFHRIIVNPLLMLVLIGALIYQDRVVQQFQK